MIPLILTVPLFTLFITVFLGFVILLSGPKNKIKTSFSGHEKFECKIDWITKGLNAFKKNNHVLSLTNVEEGIETLGLGINMIKALNHWMQVLGLIEKTDLTELGSNILEKDPY